MSMLDQIDCALVLAPHPDDEILGCGGTMARLIDMGRKVHVAVVTSGQPPRYAAADIARVRAEAELAHACIGITQTHWLELPAAGLDTVPHADINAAIGALFASVAPDTLFLPFIGDIHRDHQLVFESALVAARPNAQAFPSRLYAYETLSETNWNAPYLTPSFVPNVFVDISHQIDRKLAAFSLFASQVRPAPHERSIDTLRALATLRGATAQLVAAEAFVLIREIG